MPDFGKRPALCAFDMDGQGSAALIPSEFLELAKVGEKKVRFVLDEKRLRSGSSKGENGGQGKESNGGTKESRGAEGVGQEK